MRRSLAIAAAAVLVFGSRGALGAENTKPAAQEAARPPAGLSGVELDELESDFNPEVKRFIIPPFYKETAGPLELKFFFPFYFQRTRVGQGARDDFGVLPFYWRYREGASKADVYFPLYWRFRSPESQTDLVLQTFYNRSDHGFNLGIAPLLFLGRDTRDSSNYQVVPPLFWRFVEGSKSFMLAGIYYDKREGADYDRGLPPLFFSGRERYKLYFVVAPPLFWHFEDEIAYTTETVVPPFFYNTREHGWSFGAVPLLYLARDRDWDRTLLTPFYYGSRWQMTGKNDEKLGEARTHVIPILGTYYRHGPGLSQGGSLILHHWYWNRGDYMKMYSPFVWLWGNTYSDDDALLVPPFFYRRESPVRDDTMAGLVYWNFHEHYRERTLAIAPLFAHNWSLYERRWRTWVAPTFDLGVKPDGYHFRLHPLFYRGKDSEGSHLVVAPLLWKFTDEEDDDFVFFPLVWRFNDLLHDDHTRVYFPLWWQFDDHRKDKRSRVAFPLIWDFNRGRTGERTTLVAPLVWRDRDPTSTMTGFLNLIWHKGEIKGNRFWTFQIFPLLALGHPPAPTGAYWSVLGGLAGWRRQGHTKEMKILWIPFRLGRD